MDESHKPWMASQGTPVFSNEIRLGLVLYGGVSLAVYMNGVSHEFFEAVRGRGVYKLIKALTDSDIIVDIVSGTSAGGVNGILLAYSLVNSTENAVWEFGKSSNLWINSGSIEKLYAYNKNGMNLNDRGSIFSGDFYQRELEKAFPEESSPSPKNEWFSNISELDLFITATDLDGRVRRIQDQTGSFIDVKNHRTVFHLEYRQDQLRSGIQSFSPSIDTTKSLAKLARMTSCFPLAFPVVTVDLYPREENKIDARLVRWGDLWNRGEKSIDPSQKLSFVDGGVLSNRPFSTTIDAIYSRTSYRPTSRKLFYVDPNPDRFFDQPPSENWSSQPFKVGYNSKIEIPNYQSISTDLDRIYRENQHVYHHKELRKRLERLEVDELRHELTQGPSSQNEKSLQVTTYRQCRLMGFVDQALEALGNHVAPQIIADQEQSFRKAAEMRKEQIREKAKDKWLDDKGYEQIISWDCSYYIRKYCFLIGTISRFVKEIQTRLVTTQERSRLGNESEMENTEYMQYFLSLRHLSYQLSWQLEIYFLLKKSQELILRSFEAEDIVDEADGNVADTFVLFLRTFYTLFFSKKDSSFDDSDESWEDVLMRYYEFLSSRCAPKLDKGHSKMDWHTLSSLLPECESEFSQRVFSLIYALPQASFLEQSHDHPMDSDLSRDIARLKFKVQNEMKMSTLHAMNDQSILCCIDNLSKCFFDSVQSELDPIHAEKLKLFLDHFDAVDYLLFPYEYFSGVSTRNQVEIVRVSPNDASQYGYGRDKSMEQKLRGWSFNAFGGFMRGAWRSNDLLWGRLDSLDRIVAGLLTPEAMADFQLFHRKHQGHSHGTGGQSDSQASLHFLEELVDDCLPWANPQEHEIIIDYLASTLAGTVRKRSKHNEKYQTFLKAVIQAGQRNILMEATTDTHRESSMSQESRNALVVDLQLTEKLFSANNASVDQIGALYAAMDKLHHERDLGRPRLETCNDLDAAFRHYQEYKETSDIYKNPDVSLDILLKRWPNEVMAVLRWFLDSLVWKPRKHAHTRSRPERKQRALMVVVLDTIFRLVIDRFAQLLNSIKS